MKQIKKNEYRAIFKIDDWWFMLTVQSCKPLLSRSLKIVPQKEIVQSEKKKDKKLIK